MKIFLLSLAAAAAVTGAALPASAQPWRDGGHAERYDDRRGPGYDDQRGYGRRGGYNDHLNSGYVDGLFWKLDNAAREGRLSWGQANRLKADLRQVQELAYPVETGQASNWERRRLEQVVARIDQALYANPGYGRGRR